MTPFRFSKFAIRKWILKIYRAVITHINPVDSITNRSKTYNYVLINNIIFIWCYRRMTVIRRNIDKDYLQRRPLGMHEQTRWIVDERSPRKPVKRRFGYSYIYSHITTEMLWKKKKVGIRNNVCVCRGGSALSIKMSFS